jgi:HEAT repeat protein
MLRFLLSMSFVALLALVGPVPGARGEGDEPELLGVKLSAWLRQLEEGKEPKLRVRAVLAIDTIGATKSRKIIPALTRAVREDKEEIVREKAALALGRSVAAILAAARADAAEELPKIDVPRDALATVLRTDASDKVREAAARALETIGPDARGAVGALALALKDKNTGTIAAAADALRRMGKDAREAQPELQALLANKKAEASARTVAAFTLGTFGGDAREALPTFKEVLQDASAPLPVRKQVAESIGKLGRDGAEAAPLLGIVLLEKGLLEKALAEKDTPEREAARQLRLMAVTVLDQMGPDGKSALPALIEGARDRDLFVRCLALHAIGRLGKEIEPHRKQTVAVLTKNLEDSAVEARLAAIEALGSLGAEGLHTQTTEVVKQLKQIAERDSRKAIREAAQAAADKILPK